MGKKSRRVRDGTQYSGVKTHIVLWKSGTAIKKTLSVDLARGGTFKDMKLTLESVTSVPVARLYLVCSGCGKARYCSEACQRLDWAEHQEKCPAGRIHVPVRRG